MDRTSHPTDDIERTCLAARAAEFSLVRGGPLERAQRALGLVTASDRRVVRRAALLAAVTWLPPFALATLAGRAVSAPLGASYAGEFDAHVRSLVAIPLLLLAETVVDARFASTIRHFVSARLLDATGRAALDQALARVERWRDAALPAAALAVFALVVGVAATHGRMEARPLTWLAGGPWTLGPFSLAGWWYAVVSVPLYVFLLASWLWRWALWTWLLARLSRLDLRLVATNPDRAAGLGFLDVPSTSFGMVFFAASAVASAAWAHACLFDGVPVRSLALPALGLTLAALALATGPLVWFAPRMRTVRLRDGLRYRELAQRYVRMFDRTWCEPRARMDDATLADVPVSSLTDLMSSIDVVLHMRWAPFTKVFLSRVAASVLLPMVPIVLTQFSARDVLKRLATALL